MDKIRMNLVALCAALFASVAIMTAAKAQVVALGDSDISGPGLSSSETYPAQLQAALAARGKNVSVSNAGVVGDTTSDVLARVDSAVPQGTRLVVLWAGINDPRRGVPAATTASNIAAITGKLKARGVAIYVVSQALAKAAHKQGQVMPDGHHLNAAGQAQVVAATAPAIAAMLR